MLARTAKRILVATSIGGAAAIALISATHAREDQPAKPGIRNEAFKDSRAGFVVSHMAFALSKDAAETGACPNGMTAGMGMTLEQFASRAGGGGQAAQGQAGQAQRPAGVAAAAPAQAGGQRGAGQGGANPFGALGSVCMHPEAAKPDPGWRMVSGPNVPVDGIDLDGQDSHANGKPAPGTCAHDDFRGTHGERGIDNQFFKVVGCSKSFQSTGQSNTYEIEMYTGSWGVLLTLKGVTNLQNDNDVEVGIYANGDPIQLSPTREALPYATYAMDHDPHYRATAHGRIVNGVLTTDPVDIKLHFVVNSMILERPLQDARVKLSFTPDGGMDGYLSGYTPVEAAYDMVYGFRNGKTSKGDLAPERLRVTSSFGAAAVLGHTCNGAYWALKQAADGHRDPATGQCQSISTQYHIHMIPAFVVDAPTQSVNATLAAK